MNQGKIILKAKDFQRVYDLLHSWNEKKLDGDTALSEIFDVLKTEIRKERQRRERLQKSLEKRLTENKLIAL